MPWTLPDFESARHAMETWRSKMDNMGDLIDAFDRESNPNWEHVQTILSIFDGPVVLDYHAEHGRRQKYGWLQPTWDEDEADIQWSWGYQYRSQSPYQREYGTIRWSHDASDRRLKPLASQPLPKWWPMEAPFWIVRNGLLYAPVWEGMDGWNGWGQLEIPDRRPEPLHWLEVRRFVEEGSTFHHLDMMTLGPHWIRCMLRHGSSPDAEIWCHQERARACPLPDDQTGASWFWSPRGDTGVFRWLTPPAVWDQASEHGWRGWPSEMAIEWIHYDPTNRLSHYWSDTPDDRSWRLYDKIASHLPEEAKTDWLGQLMAPDG